MRGLSRAGTKRFTKRNKNMETAVVHITAKPGMEDKVAEFYLSQQAEYEAAPGFISRTILKAKTGTMLKAIQSRMTPEQIAKHPPQEIDADQGTEFILVERWESIEARMDFTMNRSKERDKDLFPFLLPRHAAEYYEELSR
jgi:heme-degrading monooxygenase HmoA